MLVHRRVTPSPPPPPPPPPLPPQYILRYPFIHLGVLKYYDSEVSCTRTQHSHLSEACTRTFSIRSQNTNHWVTTPPIYYLNKCTLENLRICISKPWLLKCQSIMTEKMFRIVSVLNESIEMMLKCLRNRGVISFLPPPGGPMADTSNWSTSFRIDVSFLEAKRAMRYKAITFGYDGATRRGTGSSWRGANVLRVHIKGSLFWLKNLTTKVCLGPLRLRAFWEAVMYWCIYIILRSVWTPVYLAYWVGETAFFSYVANLCKEISKTPYVQR